MSKKILITIAVVLWAFIAFQVYQYLVHLDKLIFYSQV